MVEGLVCYLVCKLAKWQSEKDWKVAGGKVVMTEAMDGGSLVPLLLDENTQTVARNSEYLIFHQSSHRVPRSAIRKGDFKLIKYWSKENKYKKQKSL